MKRADWVPRCGVPHWQVASWSVALLVAAGGCGCTSTPEGVPLVAPPECTAGSGQLDVRGCQAGIPADSCGQGFESDAHMGCNPVLPDAPCGPGELALLGETSCHQVADCGAAPWGAIPVDGNTQYVDASYGGGDSDGTAAKPWTSIGEAITAAAPGAVIAITDGSYAEDLLLEGKAVSLWGRCPAQVSLKSSASTVAAVQIRSGADGSELHGLAVTGDVGGVWLSGATAVVMDQLWVHDTGGSGIALQGDLGAPSATISATLVENTTDEGLHVVGAEADVSGSSLRDTSENTAYATGYGIAVQPDEQSGAPSRLSLSGSLLERNHTASLLVAGSQATVTDTLVRDTQPSDLSTRDGVGIIAQEQDGTRSNLELHASVVEHSYSRAVALVGSDGDFEAVHLRDTLPQQWDSNTGEGLAIINSPAERSVATVKISTIERSHQSGLLVRGSSVGLELVLVRATEPRGSDQAFGRGMAVLGEAATSMAADATIEACRVEASRAFGIWLADATATVSSTIVLDVQPQSFDGQFGDGLGAASREPALGPTTVSIDGSRLQQGAHAGVSLFGASLVLSRSTLDCNPDDLLGFETYFGTSGTVSYQDAGDNRCGCAETDRPCELRKQ